MNSILHGKLADKRHRRPDLLVLNEQSVLTLGQDQSALLVDERGNLSGVVWQDFVPQPSVLADLVAVGKESAKTRISIRVRW